MKYYEMESEILLRRCNKRGESKKKIENWEDFCKMVKLLNNVCENVSYCRKEKMGILMKKYLGSMDELMISVYVNYIRFKED